MATWGRVYVFAACLVMLCCGVRIDFAQDGPTGPDTLPLTIPVGAPLSYHFDQESSRQASGCCG